MLLSLISYPFPVLSLFWALFSNIAKFPEPPVRPPLVFLFNFCSVFSTNSCTVALTRSHSDCS